MHRNYWYHRFEWNVSMRSLCSYSLLLTVFQGFMSQSKRYNQKKKLKKKTTECDYHPHLQYAHRGHSEMSY